MDKLDFTKELTIQMNELYDLELSEEVLNKYIDLHKEWLLEATMRLAGAEIEHKIHVTRFTQLTGMDYTLDLSVTDIENKLKKKNFPVEKILKATSLFEEANKAMASGWVANDNRNVYSERLQLLEDLNK